MVWEPFGSASIQWNAQAKTGLTCQRSLLAGLAGPQLSLAGEPVEIRMQGNTDGSHVWFDPVGLRVKPGQTIRWINLDPGNSHTATAYHSKNFGRPLRIPAGAEPWNSDYLLPNEVFSAMLIVEGVYDFFCVPHEHAAWSGGSSSVNRADLQPAACRRTPQAGSQSLTLRSGPSRPSKTSCAEASSSAYNG